KDLAAAQKADTVRPDTLRNEALAYLKSVYGDECTLIREGLEARRLRGAKCAEAIAALMDDILYVLADFTCAHVLYLANPTDAEKVAVLAVGGYGRARLAPASDVDLMFLLPYKRNPTCEQFVEYILYMLWDMGLKVGHATRTIPEALRAARDDMTIRTALLESRLLWGAPDLYDTWRSAYRDKIMAGTTRAFVSAKLDERDVRHRQAGRSRYLVEPDLKEGKGGLRDLNTLFWIARYSYQIDDLDELVHLKVLTLEELRDFRRCDAFLWEVRCHLHFIAGRAQERLSFDVQKMLAVRMTKAASHKVPISRQEGMKPVEQFMRRYFLVVKTIGDLTAIFCAALEESQNKSRARLPSLFRRQKQVQGFTIAAGRLAMARKDCFSRDPVNFIRVFYLADTHALDIHPYTMRAMTRQLALVDGQLRQDETANQYFMSILTSRKTPERTLRRMNEVGVLGRFIPSFGRIVALMQFNMYHHYTADEHLLRAIGLLNDMEKNKTKKEEAAEILAFDLLKSKQVNRRLLYFAVLMHDIAKGRLEDHSKAGARIAQKLSPRFGFSKEETNLIVWLVREHLLMSDVAQRRDLSDRRTIEDFTARVQTRERLQHLFVLTQVDIQAVGPGVWNPWKASLLHTLYGEAESVLAGDGFVPPRHLRVLEAQAAFVSAIGKKNKTKKSQKEIAAYMQRFQPHYWLTFSTDTHLYHRNLLRKFSASPSRANNDSVIDIIDEPTHNYSCLTFIGPDHAGLFAQLSGACAAAGLTIFESRIMTTSDGVAVDTLYVHYRDDRQITGTTARSSETSASREIIGAALQPPQKRELKKNIKSMLSHNNLMNKRDKAPQKIPTANLRRGKKLDAFDGAAHVRLYNNISDEASVIEVSALDRPALLYACAQTLFTLNVTIIAARIATFGERAVDVFYVQDVSGAKITAPLRMAHITRTLNRVIDEAEHKRSHRKIKSVAPKTRPAPKTRAAPKKSVAPKKGIRA
ncbi:MAG: [protein-PII] uridylyltransferase, partial [Alphaproteobacteria bacterium]|nr:[protein-PII] uridylyltransferase [Alphaproteobacteria bacterium]